MKILLGFTLSILMAYPVLATYADFNDQQIRSQLQRISEDFDSHFDYVTIPEGSVTKQIHSLDKDYGIPVITAVNFFHWLFDTITITRKFDIGRYEVTQLEWAAVRGVKRLIYGNPNLNCPNEYAIVDGVKFCPYHPMDIANSYDIQRFIDVLNSNKGLRGCRGNIDDPSGCYRLPTEDEWRYAAQSGSSAYYFWGNNSEDADKYAWYFDNSRNKTHIVGRKLPNLYGLHDTAGNVAERVSTGLLLGGGFFSGLSSLTIYDNNVNDFSKGGFRLVRAR